MTIYFWWYLFIKKIPINSIIDKIIFFVICWFLYKQEKKRKPSWFLSRDYFLRDYQCFSSRFSSSSIKLIRSFEFEYWNQSRESNLDLMIVRSTINLSLRSNLIRNNCAWLITHRYIEATCKNWLRKTFIINTVVFRSYEDYFMIYRSFE